jgi:ABC-type multidrug transport system fused ATPase/permease subunit
MLALLSGNTLLLGPLNVHALWRIPASWLLAGQSPLQIVGGLLLLVAMIGFVQALSLLWLYRESSRLSIEYTRQVYEKLFAKSRELARMQSVSGQKAILGDMLQDDLHSLRFAWCHILRSVPRHIFLVIGCLTLSLLIDPVVAILVILCFALLRQLFNWAQSRSRRRIPVLAERVQDATRELDETFVDAPLLESVHHRDATLAVQESQLRRFVKTHVSYELNESWQIPVVVLTSVLMSALIGFVVAVRILDSDNPLMLYAAMTLAFSLTGVVVGSLRLVSTWRTLDEAGSSAKVLNRFLGQPVPEQNPANIRPLKTIDREILIEHVTLRDGDGGRLLEDLSARLVPGKLTAIVGSNSIERRALGELMLGFGQPASGRMLFDDLLSTDIDVDSFRRNCCWVSGDGPITVGTLEENLVASHSNNGNAANEGELTDVLRAANVYEAIQHLPDGLATLVAPRDDRLNPDYLFRLGIARAILRRPAIVVAEEPAVQVKPAVESETLAAMHALMQHGALLVVLPNRLTTLRAADEVLVVHDHKLVATGTHAQLLESSEIYRHLNYVRFSPLMNIQRT